MKSNLGPAASTHIDANGSAFPKTGVTSGSEKEAAELAKELQNPVANLISVPFQTKVDAS